MRHLPNGSWEARIQVEGRRISRSAPTRREALAKVREAAQAGRVVTRSRGRTVADAVAAHTRHMNARVNAGTLAANTRDWYVRMLQHAPLTARLDRLSPADLEAWQANLQGSPSLHNGTWRALRAALQTALRDRLTANDPMAGLPTPSGESPEEAEHATEDDVRRLLEAAEDPWRALWTVLAYTGLRRSEAISLEWQDVDLEAGTLYVRRVNSKTRKARAVPLVPEAADALARVRANRPGPFPYNPRTVNRRFDRDSPRPGLTPHSLRHGLATRLLEAGTPVHVVAAILGHSSPRVTLNTYAHSVSELEREALLGLRGGG